MCPWMEARVSTECFPISASDISYCGLRLGFAKICTVVSNKWTLVVWTWDGYLENVVVVAYNVIFALDICLQRRDV